MWDSLFKIAFYGSTGLALAGAVVWYLGSLCSTLTGKGEVVIAPFEIVRTDGTFDTTAGVALANMLQVQLREIERNIDAAQKQLVGKPPEGRAEGGEGTVALTVAPVPISPLLIQGVGMQTKLLEPADIKVSVAGVEVGQVLPWLQRQLVNRRTVVFTLYQKKQGVHVTGALTPMGLSEDSLALDVGIDGTEELVPLDRVVERMAYAITRRRLAGDPNNRVEVLDDREFQSLVEILQETARLNVQVARSSTTGSATLASFQELLKRATVLADGVDKWHQLNNLTASIAESAKDLVAAIKFYERALEHLPERAEFDALRTSLTGKIADLKAKTAPETPPVASAVGSPAEQARLKMQGYVNAATEFFNDLLMQTLKPPSVKLQTDRRFRYSPYFDGTSMVADQGVQFLPDMAFRNAAWPQLLALTGTATGRLDDANDIIYSAADILTMVMHQNVLKQDAKSSDWALHRGFKEWTEGKTLTKPFEGTPFTSFSNPPVAHIRQKSTDEFQRQYANSGIFNKVFYLVATKRSTERAAEIWIGALRQMKTAGRVDYLRFARLLVENAGPDQEDVRQALLEVGLDIGKSAAKTKPRRAKAKTEQA